MFLALLWTRYSPQERKGTWVSWCVFCVSFSDALGVFLVRHVERGHPLVGLVSMLLGVGASS